MIVLDAPHLSSIVNALMVRPLAFGSDPFFVSVETYACANAEMSAIMRERGWPVMAADIGRLNFLLMGVPICPAEAVQ